MGRALSPTLGTLLLLAITVALAAVLATTLGTAAIGAPLEAGDGPELARLSATAEADGTITLTHEAGDPIDLEATTVSVTVDGTPLETQPPVPFFSTTGFEPGPTGPFNSATDNTWRVGERGSFTIAGSNEPAIEPGRTITVELTRDGRPVAAVETSVLGDDAD